MLRSWWVYCPIIVVTASPGDDIVGLALAAGANDYLRKPMNPKELAARLHARTVEMQQRAAMDSIQIGDSTLDIIRRCLSGKKGKRHLSELDARLLAHLARSPETLISRPELKQVLWGGLRITDNALDKRLCELRQALRDVGASASLLSYYGKGLRLTVNQKQVAA